MSPIKGLTESRRLPRLGKIHLGVKVTKNKKGEDCAPYPRATDYFVCPDEVKAVYGEEPKSLDIIIPVEDEELWANQYYRQYSRSRGLVCKGDGEVCRRMIDISTGDAANRDTTQIAWKEMSCAGKQCPDYQAGKCKEVMNLQFLLPRVPGLGIWQVDTGSINSIQHINNMATMIRAVCDRVSWLPLVLTLEPVEVTNPDDGKKKMVKCLNLRHGGSVGELLTASLKARTELLITAPAEDEAPMDEAVETVYIVREEPTEPEEMSPEEELFPEDGPEVPAPDKHEPVETSDEPAELKKGGEGIGAPTGKDESGKGKGGETILSPPGKAPKKTAARDPSTIKNFGDLFQALWSDFHLAKTEALKELNVNSQEEITELPSECYLKIATVR